MSISLYHAIVPQYVQVLPSVGALVEKARAHCKENGLGDEALTDARLAPDMWNFAKQVTSACLHSAAAIAGAREGETGPDLEPAPLSFDALAERVAGAVAYLRALKPEDIDSIGPQDTCFRFGERVMPFTVEDYLLSFALPNFYFHAAMAYAVLRNQGLDVGKRDFLGAPRLKA
jgi:hypothetical protein